MRDLVSSLETTEEKTKSKNCYVLRLPLVWNMTVEYYINKLPLLNSILGQMDIVQAIKNHSSMVQFNIITHLYLSLIRGFSVSWFATKILLCIFRLPMYATCPSYEYKA